MEEYRIKGTASKLVLKRADFWKIESMYGLEHSSHEYNMPFLFLQSRGPRYLIFHCYLGNMVQKLKFPADELIEIKKEENE